VTANSTPIDRS